MLFNAGIKLLRYRDLQQLEFIQWTNTWDWTSGKWLHITTLRGAPGGKTELTEQLIRVVDNNIEWFQ